MKLKRQILISLLLIMLLASFAQSANYRGGVVLSWDDAYIEDWYKAHEMFRKYGANNTFFVSTFPKITDSVKIKRFVELAEYGHEVGVHTVNHPKAIEYVDEFGIQAYLDNEIIPCIDSMKAYGINPKTFAYPHGSRTPAIDTALFQYFHIVRGIDYSPGELTAPPENYYYDLNAKKRSVKGTSIHGKHSVPDILKGLEYAKQEGCALFLYGHPIGISYDTSGNSSGLYEINHGFLEEICKYVVANDMKFYTTTELFESPDTIKPFVKELISYNGNEVRIIFNEALDRTLAETISNYQINNSITVDSVSLLKNRREVILYVSTLTNFSNYEISLSGLKDIAMTPNTMDLYSGDFTYLNTLIIRNTRTRTVNFPVWDTLSAGEKRYVDRDYTFSSVPEKYDGAIYLRTANNDFGSVKDTLISFETNIDVVVYVAYDDKNRDAGLIPSWLTDKFTDSGDDIIGFSLYKKVFPAGLVVLGGNEGSNKYSMYNVIVEAADSTAAIENANVNEGGLSLTASPNPFNPVVNISVNGVGVQIAIYNISGKLVKMSSNATTIQWNAQNHPSGIYIVRATINGKIYNKRITLLK